MNVYQSVQQSLCIAFLKMSLMIYCGTNFFFIKDNFQSSGRREFNISVSNRISVKDRRRTEEYCKTRV